MRNAYFVSKRENLEVLKKECVDTKELLKEQKLKNSREMDLMLRKSTLTSDIFQM